MPSMKTYEPKPEHKKFLDDLKAQMPPEMPAQDILAIVSQFVGQLIALQDQRVVTPDQAMQLVGQNIEIGNRAALATIPNILKPEGEG
jgi:hypothetical protein